MDRNGMAMAKSSMLTWERENASITRLNDSSVSKWEPMPQASQTKQTLGSYHFYHFESGTKL